MENGSTLQPSGIKVQSVFLPLLLPSAGCSVLLFSKACGTDQQHYSLLVAPSPPPPVTMYGQQSLRPSRKTLVMQSLLPAIVVPVNSSASGAIIKKDDTDVYLCE